MKRTYERDLYRCYRKLNSRSTCHGPSSYSAERIEKEVLAVVHQYFAGIRSAPTIQMLQAAETRTQQTQKASLAEAEAALKKAQAEMAALKDAAVKALTGENGMDLSLFSGLIPKRKANLEHAIGEVERIKMEIQADEKAIRTRENELSMILSWADAFDEASLETKRSIIAMLIEKIVVYKDYELDIHFRLTAEQYLGRAS